MPRNGETGFSFWPTPLVGDATGGRTSKGNARPAEGGLSVTVKALWSTPRASDGEKGCLNQCFSGGGQPLPAQAARVAMWATVTHRDHRYPNSAESQERRNGGSSRGQQLPNEVAHLYGPGPTPLGSSGTTAKPGACPPMNPEFVCWLMGFPAGWLR